MIILGILAADFVINWLLMRFIKPQQGWIDILCFWIAYVLTRPLGASIGDLLTADRYPSYADPPNCNPFNTTVDMVGCAAGDVYCITNCD